MDLLRIVFFFILFIVLSAIGLSVLVGFPHTSEKFAIEKENEPEFTTPEFPEEENKPEPTSASLFLIANAQEPTQETDEEMPYYEPISPEEMLPEEEGFLGKIADALGGIADFFVSIGSAIANAFATLQEITLKVFIYNELMISYIDEIPVFGGVFAWIFRVTEVVVPVLAILGVVSKILGG